MLPLNRSKPLPAAGTWRRLAHYWRKSGGERAELRLEPAQLVELGPVDPRRLEEDVGQRERPRVRAPSGEQAGVNRRPADAIHSSARHEAVDSAILASAVGFLDRVLGRTPERDEAQTRKLNACIVHAGGLLGIVGESYRQSELRVLSGRTTDGSAFREDLVDYAAEVAESEPDRRWFMPVLTREPDTPKDPNVVAVRAQGGGKLGYLPREDARRYGRVFESLEKRGYEAAACPAMLTGGGSGESYGVVLAISAPGYVLGDLTADERDAVRESKAREKDARDRAIYEAVLAGETWETVAEAHGYKTAGGARAAAHRYAERNGLEMPPHKRGPRRQTD